MSLVSYLALDILGVLIFGREDHYFSKKQDNINHIDSFDIFLQHTEFQSLFEWKHIWNEHIFDVFSSNQILWDPCYGVVYPTWEYIESYGTYK